MLTKQELERLLHADRTFPVSVPNPHSPVGLEHLAAEVARLRGDSSAQETTSRSITLPTRAWEKLEQLGKTASPEPISATEVAAVLLERALATTS